MPHEVLPGVIFRELEGTFTLLPRPSAAAIWQLDPQRSIQFGGNESVQFVNESVKIQLADRSLVFNSLDIYPGWRQYSKCINDVLDNLFKKGVLKSISRIGIRYISEYPSMSIFEVMNERPVLSLPHGEGQNITYRTEVRKDDFTIVLNVADRVSRQGGVLSEAFFSLIDIDVFSAFPHPLTNPEAVLEATDNLHKIEKEVFFGILKAEYIETLNPEYKL